MAANIAKRLGSVIKLKPEEYEKYKKLHAAVWPQVIFCKLYIRRCNMYNNIDWGITLIA